MIYADTSFLVALAVVADEHRSAAWDWWKQADMPVLMVSRLTLFEAENTIRGMHLANRLRASQVNHACDFIYRGLLEGLLLRRRVAEQRLYPHATRLSQHHTVKAGYGALDVIHVATARELKAHMLLTFDRRQAELARAVGLSVEPCEA